jgi:hypothetical protein
MRTTFEFRFVEFMPPELDEGVLYISMPYATATHRCFCGCGMKVVTPLSPTDWSLKFDGDAVSLDPSIGNWSYPCRSHYILRGNQVRWAGPMGRADVDAIRRRDRLDKLKYYGHQPENALAKPKPEADCEPLPPIAVAGRRQGLWTWLLGWWSDRRG